MTYARNVSPDDQRITEKGDMTVDIAYSEGKTLAAAYIDGEVFYQGPCIPDRIWADIIREMSSRWDTDTTVPAFHENVVLEGDGLDPRFPELVSKIKLNN